MRSVPLGSNSRLAIGACVLVAVWSSGIYCTYRSHVVVDVDDAVDVEHRNDGLQQRQRQHEIDSLLSPEAYPVYGTHIELEWNGNKNKQKNNKHNNDNKHNKISVVYAIPSHSSPGGTLSIRRSAIDASTNTTSSQLQSQLQSQSQPGVQALQTRGIVVLLHACTHNALKFFSPSPDGCPSCVGLSEELRIARIVLERGYVALAVTSGSGGGCWGGTTDSMRIQHAVNEFLRRHQSTVLATSTSTATTTTTTTTTAPPVTVYAIGASSGGAMAAALVADKIARSAAVMVMGLRDRLLDRLMVADADAETTTTTAPLRNKLYLAPMNRDKGTAKRARKNYQYVTEQQHHPLESTTTDNNKHNNNGSGNLEIVLDETSCVPLPVTPDYLWNRVPGMTLEAAGIVVDVLVQRGHLDAGTHLLRIDPTKSNWRDYLLGQTQTPPEGVGGGNHKHDSEQEQQHKHDSERRPPPVPASLLLLQQRNGNDNDNDIDAVRQQPPQTPPPPMLLWGTFDLTPGLSPLAKALHRAWAFHEYCSEAVGPALDFFENDQPNHHE